MRIFLAGGSGLIGSRLIHALHGRGDQVVLLTRRPEALTDSLGPLCTLLKGDPMQEGDWMAEVAGCDAVINLTGEGVFNRRWRQWFRELIYTSRIKSTENIVQALARQPHDKRPKVLVNASAIGYYGPTGDRELDESSPPGSDFLAQLCVDWEKAAQQATEHGVRLALVRVGLVLDPAGGALKKMIPPFKMFVGGPVGSGRQYVSWIHHEDMVGILLLALDNAAVAGPINATAPNPVTNRQLSKALGRALHRPSFFRTPGFMLRLMLGKVAGLITAGQRVLPTRVLELGYAFKFTDVDAAMADLFAPR
ncbi:MAG: TIGR01777 family oxidoreductase [Gemmataceae bacterium]